MQISGKKELNIFLAQLTSTKDVETNLKKAESYVVQAANQGADIIAFPENFAFLGREQDKLPFAQDLEGGAFVAPMQEWARRHEIAVMAGTIPERCDTPDKVYNTAVFIGADGELVASYRKIHLFDIDLKNQVTFQESAAVEPGDKPVCFDYLGWRMGLTVCYDLRFPELYRKLVDQGAELIFAPAAFTLQTGKDHWETLIRARAIENQCYLVAPGQFGYHSASRASWGKSMVVDPWGSVICLAPEREGTFGAVCSLPYLRRVREQLPCLTHRRM